jgi:hypothetical protein
MTDATQHAQPVREGQHTMTEFKKGDRVRGKYSHKPGVIVGPDSGDAYEVITDDGVHRSWLTEDIEFDDPAPLRFEDVRDGDTITVEGIDYSITGTASKLDAPACVTVGGVAIFNFDGDEGTHGAYGPPVRLTAHTRAPAEPEWHRAKVIKADADYGDGDPETGRLPTQRHGGVFLASTRVPGEFLDQSGNELTPDAFTDVTIVVDECGEVRA